MNRRDFLFRSGAAVSLGLLARGALSAQTNPAAPSTPAAAPVVKQPTPVTEFKPLRRNTGVFTGKGGTIGWLVNKDALVTVDTQFPDTAAIFLAGLPGREGRMIDAAIDSHHHWDHTAGNATFRPVAKHIVAHQNVPKLQTAAAERSPNMGPPTFPDVTFADTWRIEAGDEIVSGRYFGAAHTGGDIVTYFEKANVAHVGDLVFNRIYPVMDRPGGSSARGWIKVLEAIAKNYPADTQFIFGHGKASFGITGGQADVAVQHEFLGALVSHVEKEMKAGKSKEEIVKLTNLPGWPDHFTEQNSRLPGNLGAVYDELSGA